MLLILESRHQKKNGFTLIELIITIIIMGFAAVIIIPYLTAVTHSPDPVLREKAIGLGQAMMDEILAKRWDENAPNGGGPICTNESGTGRGNSTYILDCTTETTKIASAIGRDLGEDPGANQRAQWDDVDDYNGLTEPLGGPFYDQTGALPIPGTWTGFQRSVAVDYIASGTGNIDTSGGISAGSLATNATDTKRIIVTVTSPLGETFELVAVSCNF
ncbi:MAG: prepilin-type N-terminal cleavage/methylation domain-containing protein [Desulfurivibrionaceae bacterium]|nr:prepilin-type N-terminal cleavage/methylation domain-containing protein [Desulfurivibrionaceae bacterium]